MNRIHYGVASFILLAYDVTIDSRNVTENVRFLGNTTRCHHFNDTLCKSPDNCAEDVEQCKGGANSRCFVLWNGTLSGQAAIRNKGCFNDPLGCKDEHCVNNGDMKNGLLYCCCMGDFCNAKYEWKMTEAPPVSEANQEYSDDEWNFYVVVCLIPIAMIAAVFVLTFYIKRKKLTDFDKLPVEEAPPTPILENHSIVPIRMKGKGKFGEVWKAKNINTDEEYAVKIMNILDCTSDDSTKKKKSWQTEREIYKLFSDRENILRFVGAEKHIAGKSTQYWLIMEYHELGSVLDYIRDKTLTWEQLARLAYTSASGLAYLHQHIAAPYKPPIAHRDIKSSNILIKSDMTACIADFGLALQLEHADVAKDSNALGQVGTRRYMAPELLEGAINFTRHYFLTIDMYAYGIVLWEMASRCTDQGCPVGPYKVPFEDEIGLNVPPNEMTEWIAVKKFRPTIKEEWKSHTEKPLQGFSLLCETMEDCWDHDPEGRLTASAVKERMRPYYKATNILSL